MLHALALGARPIQQHEPAARHRLINEHFLIWLLTVPPHLDYWQSLIS